MSAKNSLEFIPFLCYDIIMSFRKGEKVFVRDYPFGKPLNVVGEVVGILGQDHYNILIKSGICEGKIQKYKYWMLLSFTESDNGLV